MANHVVIMAGGIGSRLWPVSTPNTPKQFIDLLGVGKSLIQLTVERFLPVCDLSRIWVVTSSKYSNMVKSQLPGIPESQILAEPVPRNTAPCIAYACWKIKSTDPDANIVVAPSDALVLREDRFVSVIRKSLEFTSISNSIVTVGISPDRPETGYGYICASSCEHDKIVKVNSFREKPDKQTAQKYIEAGNYFWNAGIFVWSAKTVEKELRAHAPQIADMMDKIADSFDTSEEASVLSELFPRCDKISIDYAVMEKSDSIFVIASELGWSDLGSWSSSGRHIPKADESNHVVGGDVRMIGCNNCIVHASDERKVVIKGLDGYIVAEKDGNLLICPIEDEQSVKDYL